jgi:2-keto-4-pentenoate hydratase/2-oxohepta-3-ene-1,7-dioic acid hydratase in catechol pathway
LRLVSYGTEDGWRAGVLAGEVVVDTEAAAQAAGLGTAGDLRWRSNRTILSARPEDVTLMAEQAQRLAAEDAAAGVHQLRDVVLGPPIPDPEKIICLGLNYRDHAEESNFEAPASPILFAKFRNSLTGPASDIVLPQADDTVDYEVELAVVIGRTCKGVSKDEAIEYVAGAMAFNDVSQRDLQHATGQWLPGKAIDTFAPCGPALVTRDELDDLQSLEITSRVNGEVMQSSTTAMMIFPIAETIEFITSFMTLEPGDIIATGTPGGVGMARDPQVFLREGDLVEVEVSGIGTLRNHVVATPSRTAEGIVGAGAV